MSKKSPQAPPVPDPTKIAADQTQANLSAAHSSASMNSPNLYTPGGTVTYDRDANGVVTGQHLNLGDTQQGAFDKQQTIADMLAGQAKDRVAALPTTPFTLAGIGYDPRNVDTSQLKTFGTDGLPFDPSKYSDMTKYTKDVGDAVYSQYAARLDPEQALQNRRFDQRMADQGLTQGDEAAGAARSQLSRDQDAARQTARSAATAAAGAEATRTFGMEQGANQAAFGQRQTTEQQQNADWLQRLQTEQSLRGAETSDLNLERNQNFNEATAFLQGSPGIYMPTAPQTPNYNVGATDVIGANALSSKVASENYKAQQDVLGSKWQGAAKLGAAGMTGGTGGFSTSAIGSALSYLPRFPSARRLKVDDGAPERILDQVRKMPVRTWRYRREIDPRQELHIGPYAEDWTRYLGLGDGEGISPIDANGVALQCIKELAEEIASIRSEIQEMRRAA